MADKRYQIFISSTFSDLKEHRRAVSQRLIDLNYIVAGMETFPASSDAPFEYIKPIIANSDYFILIVGSRYGSSPDHALSYTELEYAYAEDLGIPILAFVLDASNGSSVPNVDVDQQKRIQLESFVSRVSAGRMTTTWSGVDDLASSVVQAVIFEERRKPRPGWVREPEVDAESLLIENRQLREDLARIKLSSTQETMTGREMEIALGRVFNFSIYPDAEASEIIPAYCTVGRILDLESVFSDPSYNSIQTTLLIRGSKTKTNRPGSWVSYIDVDKFALILRRHKIIDFDLNATRENLRRGPNWVLAHEVARDLHDKSATSEG